MDDWEKFNEMSLPEKEDFCSHLNMEDITDADYWHAKRVCKDFEIKYLSQQIFIKYEQILSIYIYIYIYIYLSFVLSKLSIIFFMCLLYSFICSFFSNIYYWHNKFTT